jgi:hypothetical protein
MTVMVRRAARAKSAPRILAIAKSSSLGTPSSVTQDIARLDVPVNNEALVRVPHRRTHAPEKP